MMRRVSIEFGSNNNSLDIESRNSDRVSRQLQRDLLGHTISGRVLINPNGSIHRSVCGDDNLVSAFKDVDVISFAAHGKRYSDIFTTPNTDPNSDHHEISVKDVLLKLKNIFIGLPFPKELILNCCYSHSYISRLQASIRELELPVTKIIYHKPLNAEDLKIYNRSAIDNTLMNYQSLGTNGEYSDSELISVQKVDETLWRKISHLPKNGNG
jgi:hypothetical protein